MTALRSFFRSAASRGWCAPGWAAAILAPRLCADAPVPTGPSWEDVQRLRASPAGDRPQDIRARAILRLCAGYGMRVGAVRTLRFADVDWEPEIIDVTRPTPRRRQGYPLTYPGGEAILRSLHEGRPRAPSRAVLLPLQAPCGPRSSGALSAAVSARLRPLALPLRHPGPHTLRHAGATRLLAAGWSMQEIGDHRGHRQMETTRVYAKVDLGRLRQVAHCARGEVLCNCRT